ncbi:hypothetical protein DCS_00248 [Drechmeria coniospora]|uniref:Uncharacterized protein n=1 Tax=Drechmeria coniospora TaxID=98403 RepID=A0A151GPY0_DRECN|nr:hypothetical protein DCS_00248 [Drechmeria coniospora]KYK59118.1 hypothetical protein DCS_00248 [Drechmeria coniospora]ODA77871.1 hypothetical protein RJ55_06474 [Drechmeria coniospora]
MKRQPVILSPSTPSELLAYVIAHHRCPTTLLIGWPRQQFLEALIQDIVQQPQTENASMPPPSQPSHHGLLHPLLRPPSLLQTAVARHIRLAFIPSVAHLRAYIATFDPSDSAIPPPPPSSSGPVAGSLTSAPLLLVYGFLELHRDGSQWSAQGLNASAASFVEVAARHDFRPTIVEPRKTDGDDELRRTMAETIPILTGSRLRDDGTWSGHTVPVDRVLARWFTAEEGTTR